MNRNEVVGAITLAFVYVLRMLGLFMVMPVMATLGQTYPDYSAMMVGIAIGGYGLTQAIFQIPFGILSDKIGRKPVIVAGLLLFALGSFISAQADALMWVVVGRFLQGTGAIASATMALAGDISRQEHRPKVMAIIGIAIGFSFYLALFVGPFIASKWGLSGIFYTTSILSFFCIPLVIWVVPNRQISAPKRDTLPQAYELSSLLKDRNLMILNVSVCLLHIMITLVFFQLPELFSQHGMPLEKHWMLYLTVLFSSIIGLMILMKLAKTLGIKAVLLISVFLLALSFIGFVLVDISLYGIVTATVVFFIGFNFLESNFPALISNIAPAGKRGSAMGLFTSFQFFGAFAGGSLAGLLSEHVGLSSLYLLAGGICIAWLGILRNLSVANKVKRLVLSVSDTKKPYDLLQQQLCGLLGVEEAVFVQNEKVVYLKVDGEKFDLSQAEALI